MRLLLCAPLALLTGCISELTGPGCTPKPFTQASVSGDTITTSTGLRYIEGAAGNGIPADWCQTLAIHYDAYFLDGTKFDSSRDDQQALVFTPGIGGLIDGLEQGVIGMRFQGTRRLIIPPALGFGSEPRRDPTGQIVIPGNSTLVYDIEMALIVQ